MTNTSEARQAETAAAGQAATDPAGMEAVTPGVSEAGAKKDGPTWDELVITSVAGRRVFYYMGNAYSVLVEHEGVLPNDRDEDCEGRWEEEVQA